MNRLLTLIVRTDTSASGMLVGFWTMVWGIWLLLPFDLFTDIGVYRNLASLAPEWLWGIVAVLLGGSIIGSIAGHHRQSWLALVTFCWYIFIGVQVYQAVGIQATAVPLALVMAAASAWAHLQLRLGLAHSHCRYTEVCPYYQGVKDEDE